MGSRTVEDNGPLDYDEDDAWWDAIVEESKESLRDIPTETIQVIESTDHVPGSSVNTMGEPRGDQHITMSSSLVVEASDDVPVSTTMSTSTAMVVEETPTAVQGTNRVNPRPVSVRRTNMAYTQSLQREHKVLMDEARNEINALRKELASTRKHSSQVQQLLEEDSEAHPSNRQAGTSRQNRVEQNSKRVVGVTLNTLDHRKGARKGERYQRQKHRGEPGPQSICLRLEEELWLTSNAARGAVL